MGADRGASTVGPLIGPAGFEIVERLGGGAGSTVYRARRENDPDKAEYALKVLDRKTADGLIALRREAALLTVVNHPDLPRVHEVGATDRRPYLVMDLVRGTPLADLLTQGALPAERVTELALDLIGPLAAVHARGLVHRDLKPHNIMVGPDGHARLIDFGLAAREGEDEDSETPLAVGTLAYAAPEQSGMLKRPVDQRSDLYSLGVIMFEALAGVRPFRSPDVGELLRAHASLPPPDLTGLVPSVPAELAHIVAVLLAKDPDDRYQHGAALAADLHTLAGQPQNPAQPDASPLLGREAEFGALMNKWTQVRSGTGAFAIVRSDTGLGKTRLADELGQRVAEAGGTVLQARVLPGDPLPFNLFREAFTGYLNQLARLPRPERLERESRLAETFAGWPPEMLNRVAPGLNRTQSQAPAPAGFHDDQQLGDAIVAALRTLARLSSGLLLILDDMSTGDASVRQVVGRLAGQVRDVPLLLLGTARDDGRLDQDMLTDPGLEQFSAAIMPACDLVLSLAPLGETETRAQIRWLLSGQELPEESLGALATRSNGNPFVAHEYLWSVIDAGLLWPSWGTWQLDAQGLDALELPQDALSLLLDRTRDLAPQARSVLAVGAAMGAGIRARTVAAVEHLAVPQVLEILAGTTRQRLTEAGPEPGTYRFLHGRIADALLAGFGPEELSALHGRLAEAMAAETDQQSDPLHTFAMARHYLQAGPAAPAEKAVAACVDAGRQALEEQAPDDAISFLEHAVQRLEQPRAAVLVLLGQALKQAGQFAAARSRLEQALAAEDDPLARAAIHTQLAQVHRAGFRSKEMREAIHQGLRAAGSPVPAGTFALLARAATSLLTLVPRRWLRPVVGDVAGLARQRAMVITELHDIGVIGTGLDQRMAEFFYHIVRSTAWATRLGHGPHFAYAHARMGMICAAFRLPRTAENYYRRAERDESAHDPRSRSTITFFRRLGAWSSDRISGTAWRDGFDDYAASLEFTLFIECIVAFHLSACFGGRREEAQEWLAVGRTRLTGRTEEVTPFVTAAPMTAALLGRRVEAETELRRLQQLAEKIPTPALRLLYVVASLFALLEEEETGAPLDQAIDSFDALGISPELLQRSHRPVLGLIAAARLAQLRAAPKNTAEYARRLDQARRAVERLGKAANFAELKAFWMVAEADLLVSRELPRRALATLARLSTTLEEDLPTVAFEAARVAARAHRTLNPAEGRRQAHTAHAIALAEGWPHRAASVVTEFSLPAEQLSPSADTRGSEVSAGREREQLKALQDVSSAASRVLDPGVLARIALDETIRILAADRAFLFLADPGTGALSQHLGRDAAGRDLASLTGYSTSLVEMVRRTGKAQVVAGTEEGAALGAQSAVLHGLRSILVAPMTLDGRLLGVVYLDSQVAKGIFTTRDTAVLAALTSFVAASLETARAAQLAIQARTAERAAELAKALQLAQERMAAQLEPSGVLNQLLLTATTVTPAQIALILQPGPPGRLLEPGADEPATSPVDLTEDEWEQLTDAPAALRERLPGLTSWLAVPLKAETGLGILVLGTCDPAVQLAGSADVVAALIAQGMTAYDKAALFEQVQRLAVVDELTQLANRRRFFELATRDLRAAHRHHRPLIAVMLDIDHFKRVNDSYGHPTGDDVIREVARRLSDALTPTDLIGRYGGEEFAVLHQSPGNGLEFAERLRACVAGAPVPTRTGPLPVTISVGVTQLLPSDEDVSTLLARADEGLYAAKEAGRNRVHPA